MDKWTVGIMHPGAMGSFVAASLRARGHAVYWVSEGRSDPSVERAAKAGISDVGSLDRLCAECDLIVSVCPPAAAESVAMEVLDRGFRGVYLDANAISPDRARAMGRRMEARGVAFVDGGIVGGPAWDGGITWLYLAGERAGEIAPLFEGSAVAPRILGDAVGQASALKMTYAAYTKGTTALVCAILAAAEVMGVRHALEAQWEQDDVGFAEAAQRRTTRVTAKAWRFEGEMLEIAETFRQAGLPAEFHLAAAEIYRRLAPYKGALSPPSLDDVLAALARQ